MIDCVHVILSGQPIGKGRPRFTRQGRTYTPAKTKDYEQKLRQAAIEAMKDHDREPTEMPCRVVILAQFEIPKSWPKYKKNAALTGEGNYKPGKPDIDNIAKAALDAMNGVVFKDDALVSKLEVEKRYGQPLLIATVFFDE
jgi:Holliday junction resolvase RusA-like endonuclease